MAATATATAAEAVAIFSAEHKVQNKTQQKQRISTKIRWFSLFWSVERQRLHLLDVVVWNDKLRRKIKKTKKRSKLIIMICRCGERSTTKEKMWWMNWLFGFGRSADEGYKVDASSNILWREAMAASSWRKPWNRSYNWKWSQTCATILWTKHLCSWFHFHTFGTVSTA